MFKIDIVNRFALYFNQLDLQDLLIKLMLSLLSVVLIILAVKVINQFLTIIIEKRRRKETEERSITLNGNFMLSLGLLLRTVIFYSGIFASAVIILEIFKINLVSPQDFKNIGLMALKTLGVLVGARLAANFGRLAVTQMFSKEGFIRGRRAQTLESLVKNIITYLVFFMAGVMVLQIFNVNASAILASAGILGLAVGFGAQNLVKDIIGGFFILFEDQFAVGDYVEAGGVTGVVEEIGLRTCKIRMWTGQLHIIPNGGITKVTNYNRGHMMAVVTVGIAYEEDIDSAIEVLKRACEVAHREITSIMEMPVVQGVVALGDFSVNIRTVARTVPGEQWAVERELLRRFKNALDHAGIEIPYPKRVITYREEQIREVDGHRL